MQQIDLEKIQIESDNFVKERDWGKFHNPKNLAIGISIEASELNEIFHWLTDAESSKINNNLQTMSKIEDEIADIFHYLIRLAKELNINLEDAFFKKLKKNKEKYPIYLAKGKKEKYSELTNMHLDEK